MHSRTYLRRRGRLTRGQARAWQQHHDQLVLEEPDAPVDWSTWFGRDACLGVEIGFGMGDALLSWAQQDADWNLLGIDVYQPGIGALLLGVERAGLDNVRVLAADARQAMARCFAPDSVAEIRVFFPDPWPKKRHHKRRLIQPEFVAVLARCLRPGARLLVATDWQDYAQSMHSVMEQADGLTNAHPGMEFAPRPVARPLTRFEARGLRLGHEVWDLAYIKTAAVEAKTSA